MSTKRRHPIRNVVDRVRSPHRLVPWRRHGTGQGVNKFAVIWRACTYLFVSNTMLLHNVELEEFLCMRAPPVVVKLLFREVLLALGEDQELDRYGGRCCHHETGIELTGINQEGKID